MGVDAEDIDGDGDLDILVGNLSGESDSLYINHGRYFADGTARAGLRTSSRTRTRFGLGLVDFDNDGVLDLYQANGRVYREHVSEADDPYAESNLLYRGGGEDEGGGGKFAEVKPRGGTAADPIHCSRGAAFGDINNDGGIDIVVVNRDAPAYVLKNVAAADQRGNWLMARVIDEHGRDAIGAIVTLRLGERTVRRDVRTADSMLSSSDPRIHAGLGSADAVDEIEVRWPDGARERFGPLPANAIHTLERGKGTTEPRQ